MRRIIISTLAAATLFALPLHAQVLGPCGTPDANKPAAAAPAAAPAAPQAAAAQVSRVPLPGEQAPNFSLPAVIGKQVKQIKLSDYAGKWRVVCFYPADFTFV
jgi:hypothetical protein